MNKKISILVLIMIGLFFLTGCNQASSTSGSGESQEDMMARMHPDQQNSNVAPSNNNDMSSHHGGGSIAVTDDSNIGLNKISFSSAIGQIAPDFTLLSQDGSEFKLSDYKNKTVVLFFNEGAMCYPACWEQIASLGKDSRFNSDNVVSASIVVDSKDKWDKIINAQPKYGAGNILFDTNKAVANAYDVMNLRSSMHKGDLPGHTYVIIKEGKISYVLDDPNMALNNDNLASQV